MVELARGAHLALEAAPDVLGDRDVLSVGLHRDGSVEKRVVRLVDDAHRAMAEQLEQLVAAEPARLLGAHRSSLNATTGSSAAAYADG